MAVISVISSGALAAPNFTSLTTWEAWVQGQFPGTPDEYIAECNADYPAGYLADTVVIDVPGTTPTNKLVIRAAAGSKYDIEADTGFKVFNSPDTPITTTSPIYVDIEDIAIVSATYRAFVAGPLSGGAVTPVAEEVRLYRCYLENTADTYVIWQSRYSAFSLYSCVVKGHYGIYLNMRNTPIQFNPFVNTLLTSTSLILGVASGSPNILATNLTLTLKDFGDIPSQPLITLDAASSNCAFSGSVYPYAGTFPADSTMGVTSADFDDFAGGDYHPAAAGLFPGAGTNSVLGINPNDFDDLPFLDPPSIGAYEIAGTPVAPVIDTQPSPVTVTEPASASMTTAATGATSSQWYKGTPPGGVLQTGETGDTITWNPSAQADSGDYYNKYTNATGDTDTLSALLTVNAPVVIDLDADPISQLQSLSGVGVTQSYSVSLNAFEQAQQISTVSMVLANQLIPATIEQLQELPATGVTQAYLITLAGLEQNQELDAVALSAGLQLALNAINQSQTIGATALSQEFGTLTLAELIQAQEAGPAQLSNALQLLLNGIEQAQELTPVGLSGVGNFLSLAEIDQSQIIEAVTLNQANILSLNEMSQQQIINSVRLGSLVIAGLDGILTIYTALEGDFSINQANDDKPPLVIE